MKKIIFLILLGTTSLLSAQKIVLIENAAELTSAIASANAGDILLLKNGEWKNTCIDFSSNANSKSPITLRAQTPGKVILTEIQCLLFQNLILLLMAYFSKMAK